MKIEINKKYTAVVSKARIKALNIKIEGRVHVPENAQTSSIAPLDKSLHTIKLLTDKEQDWAEKLINPTLKEGWLAPYNKEVWRQDPAYRATISGKVRKFDTSLPFDFIHLKILLAMKIIGEEGEDCLYDLREPGATFKFNKNDVLHAYMQIMKEYNDLDSVGRKVGFVLATTSIKPEELPEHINSKDLSAVYETYLFSNGQFNSKRVLDTLNVLNAVKPTFDVTLLIQTALYKMEIVHTPTSPKAKYTCDAVPFSNLKALKTYFMQQAEKQTDVYTKLSAKLNV